MGSFSTVLVCLLIGIGMYVVLLMFNPLPEYFGNIVPMADSIAESLHVQFLSNPMVTSILGTVSGGAFVKMISSKIQSQRDAAAQKIQNTMERSVMDKVNQITQLTREKEQLTGQLTDQTVLKDQLVDAKNLVSQKDVQISQLQTEKKELERVLAQKTVIVEKTGVH